MTEKIKTISILGPTASGKTGLAIALAKKLDGEVVSCDSMQLYRGMNVGTATPDEKERDGVVHHLFDIIDPEQSFSAADYAKLASEAIEDIASRGKLPILCGGTGLYHDSLMRISGYAPGEQDEELRQRLFAFAEQEGNEALHQKLAAIDPEAALAIHPNNVKRVVRAIEIFETTGKTKTDVDKEQLSGEIPYDDTMIVLQFEDRARLYARTDLRVDLMMKEGLLEEAEALLNSGRAISQTAAQAIGYKEFLPYFAGEQTLAQVADAIKLATRHYAKRQIMWFRRYPEAHFVVPDEGGVIKTAQQLADEVTTLYQSR